MHVRHFYHWGYFHPITCGADVVAANQLEYFRARGWTVDCVVAHSAPRARFADAFRQKYDWVQSVSVVDLPPSQFTLREQLFAYEHACQSAAVARAVGAPADLFFTNYIFTSPLLRLLPRWCKRVLETVDVLAPQFALAERLLSGSKREDPLAATRQAFLLQTELELYRLYDATLMINERELDFIRARGIGNASYVPQSYEPPAPAAPRDGHDHDLIFVASSAPVNAAGMNWFYRNVYVPYLWRHGVRLLIVGGVCPYLNFHDAHVTMIPEVPGSLADHYAASKLAIAPVFEGTGLSIKTLEALAMGSAMVLTPAGARGFDDGAGAYVKVDMKADPWRAAEVILELLANPERRAELQQAARDYVRRSFSRERYFGAMDRVLASVGFGQEGGARAA
jgi:glycosyltransferase involved in cell wall biosynthesis